MAETDRLDLLSDLIDKARAEGADAADAVAFDHWALTHEQRLGKTEGLERAEETEIGLRVLFGRRQASVSSTDLNAATLAELAARAVAMAREAPEDPWCGLADPSELAREIPDLDTCDPEEPSPETLRERAAAAEDAARAVPGVTNSEGAEASWSRTAVALAASNGFSGAYIATHSSIAASVLAGTGTEMERDHEWHSACFAADLRAPEDIGRIAGERAVARLHPRKADTAAVPVMFENRVAGTLLRSLAGAISGPAIARGTSFLKDRLETAVMPASVTVFDDPLRRRGLRSKPFDAEGIATRRRALIEAGVLKGWLLDCASARQLGLSSTGNAARSTSGPPSPAPSNLYMEPGSKTPDALMKDMGRGLLVTEMMGMGVNIVTGDYSRGAAGFWIEDGAIAHAVSEVTIAGNMADMFLAITAADDLEFRRGTDAPSLLIDGMTVAGR